MKTIRELRDFIKENGGAWNIGSLKFSIQADSEDIDISFKGNILAWIRKSEDEKETKEAELSVISNFSLDTQAVQKEEKPAPKDDKAQHALGMVEAYEKILLGRDLQIGR